MSSFKPTHDELVERAVRWLVGTGGCSFAVPEITVGGVWETPDAIGWHSSGDSILIECKTRNNPQENPRWLQYGGFWGEWHAPPDLAQAGPLGPCDH